MVCRQDSRRESTHAGLHTLASLFSFSLHLFLILYRSSNMIANFSVLSTSSSSSSSESLSSNSCIQATHTHSQDGHNADFLCIENWIYWELCVLFLKIALVFQIFQPSTHMNTLCEPTNKYTEYTLTLIHFLSCVTLVKLYKWES